MFKRVTVGLLAAILVAAMASVASAQDGPRRRYIVVLKDSVADPHAVAQEHQNSHAAEVSHVYEHALKG